MLSRKRSLVVTRRVALIVEDNPQLQRTMAKQLERMEFDVLAASHYEAAVVHLTRRDLHVVCIDVGLPSKSGYQLCELMRGTLGLVTPVIMTSDYGSPGDMAYAEDAGANAFVRKPFTMHELAHCIESLLNATGRGPAPTHELEPLASTLAAAAYLARQKSERVRLFAA